ncbi:anthranilate phosphoribosyltransferase [Alicyclobacillaceae bacterium I2511]|nr:anthranilate phosphoribosyltransferase [Alicyclobacillaceae bacterium I2511]
MPTSIREVLKIVSSGNSLNQEIAESFMNELMSGQVTPVQTAGLLAALTVRGETVDEIVGFARAMRRHAVTLRVPFDVMDTCGTGGDGAKTFNISTAAAFVGAAAGIPIAKHGNRAVSSRSGSADVLAALGADIDLTGNEALSCLEDANLCFLFAQSYHPAMKHAAEARKQLGFRTVFNILGPLTNPAGATKQVLGVFQPHLVEKVAEALLQLGTTRALVVHGAGGIDELSLQGPNSIAEVVDGRIHRYTLLPEDCGLERADLAVLIGGDARENAAILHSIFAGEKGPRRDVVVLNAAAVLYVGGKTATIQEGALLAAELIDSGSVLASMQRFITATALHPQREVAQ